jgi:peptidoglycan/LPS O-acetylase OafA/YrhL
LNRAPGIRHIPALDGLRGLAVAAVVLFHTGHLRGGFLGVDLFFTLSGFLITSLLVGERLATGRTDLVRFWARRARRLLPALFALLLAMPLYAAFLAQPFELDALRVQTLASLLYVANWNAIVAGADYWARENAPSLLQHTWSLAIEEQFYVVWPLVFAAEWKGALARAGAAASSETGLRRVLLVSVVFAALSLVVMLVAAFLGASTSRLYFGSDTRFASILVGCALACAVQLRAPVAEGKPRALLEAAAAAALAGIVASWFVFDGQSPFVYRGGLVVLAVAASVVLLAAVHPRTGPLAALLSFAPLRGLGILSYGLYLWHWPVLQLLGTERTGLVGAPLLAAQLVVSLAVSVLSYFALEKPVRSGRLVTARQARVLVPAMFVAVTAAAIAWIRAPEVDRTAFLRPLYFDASRFVDDAGRPRAPRVFVVGDSVGDSLAAALAGREERTGVEVVNRARIGCNVQREVLRLRFPSGATALDNEGCAEWIDRWPGEIAAAGPDVVALVIGWGGGLEKELDGQWRDSCDATYLAWYRPQLVDALTTLGRAGVPVAMTTAPYRGDGAHPLQPRDAETDCQNPLYLGLRAEFPGLAIVDLKEHVCPEGVCRPSVEGQRLRPDGLHFHGASAVVTGSWLVEQLLALPGAGGARGRDSR